MATATRKTIATEWIGWIRITRPDGSTGGAQSVHGGTISEFMADIFKIGTFLLGEPGRKCRAENLERVCSACSGLGTKEGRKCKACKGKPVLETIPDFDLDTYGHVKITR